MFHQERGMQDEFFSVKEVANILKVHPNTIYRAIEKGYIRAIRVGDRKRSPYRISKIVVEKMHPKQIHLGFL
jgi:excisionase family DNA binding protein